MGLNKDIFKGIVNKLVSGLNDVEVNASYNSKSTNKKSQVVINPPNITESDAVYDEGYVGESIVNIDIEVYGVTLKQMDDIADDVSSLLRQNDIERLDYNGSSSAMNVITVNDNKYFGKVITFTYLVN